MSECRLCGIVLVSLDNWTASCVGKKMYECKYCRSSKQREYHNKSKEDRNRKQRERYHKNRIPILEKMKYTFIKRKYNLSKEEHLALMADAQCGICFSKKDLVVDHDHVTEKIRGVLCRKCNMGIGLLGDEALSIYDAYKYLRKASFREIL